MSLDDYVKSVYVAKVTATDSETVKNFYESAVNSKLGRKVSEILKGQGYRPTAVDEYGVVELDKNALAAYITDGVRSAVAIGKDYFGKLVKDPANRLMAMVHEYAHAHKKNGKNAGEKEAYGAVSRAAADLARQSNGLESRVYQGISYASHQGQMKYA